MCNWYLTLNWFLKERLRWQVTISGATGTLCFGLQLTLPMGFKGWRGATVSLQHHRDLKALNYLFRLRMIAKLIATSKINSVNQRITVAGNRWNSQIISPRQIVSPLTLMPRQLKSITPEKLCFFREMHPNGLDFVLILNYHNRKI